MPRKRAILERVVNLIKSSSFFMAKIKKPIRLKLIILRKSRNFKKLIKHNNNNNRGYTPLFHYQSDSSLKTLGGSRNNLSCSMFFPCYRRRRSNGLRIEVGSQEKEQEVDYSNHQLINVNHTNNDVLVRHVLIDEGEFLNSSEEGEYDANIDRKAEMFIQRFYQEMRLERQDSNRKLMDIVVM